MRRPRSRRGRRRASRPRARDARRARTALLRARRAPAREAGSAQHRGRAARARRRGARVGRSERTRGDLRLGERRDGAQVGREVRGEHIGDDAARLPEPPQKDLGPREHQALHRRVACIAETRELVGRRPCCAGRAGGIALAQRDLHQGRAHAREEASVVRGRRGLLEGAAREHEIAELRVRDASQRQAQRPRRASHERQRAERIAGRERACGEPSGRGGGERLGRALHGA